MNREKANSKQLADHFFRHNYAKMVAILVNHFGLREVEVAEDIVQDTLVSAMEQWSVQAIPDNPEAWLMDVAKKKTINLLKRKQLLRQKILPHLTKDASDLLSFDQEIEKDSTLRMIFSCCHPDLPPASQIALALKTLCGLSVSEIARALLSNEATVNKRLYRAKQKFRDRSIAFEIPAEDKLEERLDRVYSTLYLLFNEGYYASHHEHSIRTELCFEAIRLQKQMVAAFPHSNQGKALLSLMLLSVARFESRLDQDKLLVTLEEQDREQWDKKLIAEGIGYLSQASRGKDVNSYILQAGIAAEHCLAPNFESTNWISIYKQYSLLEKIDNNSLIKLNKAIAEFYANRKTEALSKLKQWETQFKNNVYYQLTLGVFYKKLNQNEKALFHFEAALNLSTSEREKVLIHKRMQA